MIPKKRKLALIVGSGFSAEANIPTTSKLSENFLETPQDGVLSPELEEKITDILKRFWREVFGYIDGSQKPSLEDHFTMLDLSANSGHQLGCYWSPKRLRAIRRMSIHRVFQMLDAPMVGPTSINNILSDSKVLFDTSIVSLNWDIVIEKITYPDTYYGIETFPFPGDSNDKGDLLLLKLHGSSNWVYCDNCRKIYSGNVKNALYRKAYLEKSDFYLFDLTDDNLLGQLENAEERKCLYCGNTMGGRIGTFSYRKDFSISQFQEIWNNALNVLIDADNWIFMGYSLPQADYEFRNLLKTAQLARREQLDIQAIVKKDINWDGGKENFQRFFGSALKVIFDEGVANWANEKWPAYKRQFGVDH